MKADATPIRAIADRATRGLVTMSGGSSRAGGRSGDPCGASILQPLGKSRGATSFPVAWVGQARHCGRTPAHDHVKRAPHFRNTLYVQLIRTTAADAD